MLGIGLGTDKRKSTSPSGPPPADVNNRVTTNTDQRTTTNGDNRITPSI